MGWESRESGRGNRKGESGTREGNGEGELQESGRGNGMGDLGTRERKDGTYQVSREPGREKGETGRVSRKRGCWERGGRVRNQGVGMGNVSGESELGRGGRLISCFFQIKWNISNGQRVGFM